MDRNGRELFFRFFCEEDIVFGGGVGGYSRGCFRFFDVGVFEFGGRGFVVSVWRACVLSVFVLIEVIRVSCL